MSYTIEYTATLETCVCWCGINLAVPENLLRIKKENGESIYCPLGHKFHYGESTADKLRKKLAIREESLDRERQRSGRLAAERDQIEAQRRAQKAATTRARRRHASGVCPCCKRQFQNVVKHMATQHPDFDPAA